MDWPSHKSDSASMCSSNYLSTTSCLSIRERIEEKLGELEQDYTIVDQLYKVHKKRAAETNVTAYKTAYKSNAQKVGLFFLSTSI